MVHRLAVHHAPRWQPRRRRQRNAIAWQPALLAAIASTGTAHAAALEARADWNQIYWVTLASPSQPGYPTYPLPVDGRSDFQQSDVGPLNARLGDASVRMLAQARTGIGDHHVQSTLIGRSRDVAPMLVIPSEGQHPVPVYTPQRIRGWLQVATAHSRVTDSFTAATTATAQANLYAASTLGIQLGISEALSSWYGAGSPGYGDITVYSLMSYELVDVTPDAQGNAQRRSVASLGVTSTLLMSGLKLIDTTVVNQFSDRFFTYDAYIEHSDTVFRDGMMVSNVRDGAGGFNRVMDDSGVALGHASAGNHTAAFNLVAGHRYELSTSFYCSTTLGGITAFLQGTNAFCDGGQSAYWNGLSDVTGADGQPLDTLSVVSDSGFDYRWASPLSTSPDAILPPSPVPEPHTWALLAGGLAMLVVRARRAAGRQA